MAKRLTQCLVLCILALGLLGQSVFSTPPQIVEAANGANAPRCKKTARRLSPHL